ncbi:MAG: type II secretion system protein GspG [Candidatus Rokubacteria bacterium]|nr:type II secretion system protein GspG [Candidatus Rokubacteria bacterium]
MKLGNERGLTLGELMIAVTIIGILMTIAIPLYADILARSRVAQAQADLRTIASAVSTYSAHVGAPPATLDSLTATAKNARDEVVGPFMASIPKEPSGWSTYAAGYSADPAAGTFTLTATGDGRTITVP